jgi:hypothetical protein
MKMTVPKMTYAIPLRRRLTFTLNALPTVILNASREHEIILMLDKCPLEHEFRRRPDQHTGDTTASIAADLSDRNRVYRWIDSHQKLLDEHHVKVMEFHGDERHWTGGLRSGAAMNMAVRASALDWILCFGDEDCIFLPNWDVALWSAICDRDPLKHVALPVMVMPGLADPYPDPLTSEWIHAQRERCCHTLTYPIRREYAHDAAIGRIDIKAFERFAELAKQPGVHEEECGERRICHWVPLLMHRQLFENVGGYPVSDHSAKSYDIHFDDALRDRCGARKRMPLDSMLLHAKQFVRISDEIDRVWGDAELLQKLGSAVL